jgi:hypothetical protein
MFIKFSIIIIMLASGVRACVKGAAKTAKQAKPLRYNYALPVAAAARSLKYSTRDQFIDDSTWVFQNNINILNSEEVIIPEDKLNGTWVEKSSLDTLDGIVLIQIPRKDTSLLLTFNNGRLNKIIKEK